MFFKYKCNFDLTCTAVGRLATFVFKNLRSLNLNHSKNCKISNILNKTEDFKVSYNGLRFMMHK